MTKQRFTAEESAEVAMSYLDGASLPKLAKIYGTSYPTLVKAITSSGVAMRSISHANRRYTCDHRYFDRIDTEAKAYWLGFLAADGCVSDRGEVSMALAATDASHVRLLRQHLESNHPIRTKMPNVKNAQQHELCICSPELAASLARQGVVPRKGLIIKPASLPKRLMRHYWRGVFDGDGSISTHRQTGWRPEWRPTWHVCLAGTKYMMAAYSRWVRTLCDATASVRPIASSYQCTVTGRVNSAAVLRAMYANSTVYLERKLQLYQRCIVDAAIPRRPRNYYKRLAG